MKQEILHVNCAETLKGIVKSGKGEYVSFVPGRSLNQYHCDYCGNIIEPLVRCFAFSIWTDTIPYITDWESNYILREG